MVNAEAAQLISKLGLVPLAGEGGFFAEAWKSPQGGPGGRPFGSAILFLITEEDFSALHQLRTDEIWHFHAGDPAELTLLDPSTGTCSVLTLGPDVGRAHVPHAVVPGGVWQGAGLAPNPGGGGRGWALFGCTMAPAWAEGECELGERAALVAAFPAHEARIRGLTR